MTKISEKYDPGKDLNLQKLTHLEVALWETVYNKNTADLRSLVRQKERELFNNCNNSKAEKLEKEIASIYRAIGVMDQLSQVYRNHTIELFEQYQEAFRELFFNYTHLKKDFALLKDLYFELVEGEKIWIDLLNSVKIKGNE